MRELWRVGDCKLWNERRVPMQDNCRPQRTCIRSSSCFVEDYRIRRPDGIVLCCIRNLSRARDGSIRKVEAVAVRRGREQARPTYAHCIQGRHNPGNPGHPWPFISGCCSVIGPLRCNCPLTATPTNRSSDNGASQRAAPPFQPCPAMFDSNPSTVHLDEISSRSTTTRHFDSDVSADSQPSIDRPKPSDRTRYPSPRRDDPTRV